MQAMITSQEGLRLEGTEMLEMAAPISDFHYSAILTSRMFAPTVLLESSKSSFLITKLAMY